MTIRGFAAPLFAAAVAGGLTIATADACFYSYKKTSKTEARPVSGPPPAEACSRPLAGPPPAPVEACSRPVAGPPPAPVEACSRPVAGPPPAEDCTRPLSGPAPMIEQRPLAGPPPAASEYETKTTVKQTDGATETKTKTKTKAAHKKRFIFF